MTTRTLSLAATLPDGTTVTSGHPFRVRDARYAATVETLSTLGDATTSRGMTATGRTAREAMRRAGW